MIEWAIRVRDLSVAYGDEPMIRNVSVDIPARKITAIIGPSGCGKTMLLRSMGLPLDRIVGVDVEGQVLFHEQDLYGPCVDVTEMRWRIGLLAQNPFPLHMSIYDNVVYDLRSRGLREWTGLDVLVERKLRAVGLWEETRDRLHTPAADLSIGQQQRLCLARELARGPEVLLCDEATSALDPVSAQCIEDRLMELKTGCSIVLVPHVLGQARRLADYVVFLHMGELVEHGPASQVLVDPREDRTRAYLEGESCGSPVPG